jgi:hypothetical protein
MDGAVSWHGIAGPVENEKQKRRELPCWTRSSCWQYQVAMEMLAVPQWLATWGRGIKSAALAAVRIRATVDWLQLDEQPHTVRELVIQSPSPKGYTSLEHSNCV